MDKSLTEVKIKISPLLHKLFGGNEEEKFNRTIDSLHKYYNVEFGR